MTNVLQLTSDENTGGQPMPRPPADTHWRMKYEKHLRSAQWKNTRRDLFRMRGAKCEVCGVASSMLEVHHLNYDRLGREMPSDLKIVCKPCHDKEDRRRELAIYAKRQARREASAFDTWFQKKTGMDSFHAIEGDYELFQAWLERKAEQY